MDTDRHQKLSKLFQAACDLPPDQQEAYLHNACDGDNDLQSEVQAMLDLDDSRGDALSDTSLDAGSQFRTDSETPTPSPSSTVLPESIGQYTLHGIIGRGGMGTVYEARQDDLNRSVALKVLRSESASPEALLRFRIEAQVLGQLSHPGIARIYDTGTFDDGFGAQPWFAMELIKGESITAYAKKHNLDVSARLELMITICEAVHHAHQKGVVHRDLKPENILVDEQGQPRILDFGVARVTNSDLQTTTINTRVGQLIGTIPYMSPEQVAGDSSMIDARCDVYALGVVLFELLSGRLPHDLLDKPIPEAVRAIRDEEPSSLGTINSSFRGDLDTILAKSLEKELQHRYQSARELAGDLRHFLLNEPIMARPASTLYQLRKFARRNRTLVGATLLIMVLLMAGIVGTTLGLSRAIDARADAQSSERHAQTELAKSRQVTSFLRQLLTGIEPEIARGRDVTVLRTILDNAVRDIDTELAGQGEVEAQLRNTIGETFRTIGVYDQAEMQFSRSLELMEELNLKNDPLWFETSYNLARLRIDQGRAEEALAIFQEHLHRHIQMHGRNHPTSIHDALGILRVYQYQYEWGKINNDASEWLPVARETLGDEHPDSISILKILADAKNFTGHQDEAAALYEEVLRFERSHLGDDHPRTMFSIRGLASCYRRMGRLDDAEPLYREFVRHCLSVYGSEHKTTADARNSLALLLKNQKHYEESEALYLKVLEFNRRELGDQHKHTLITMYNLAGVYMELKRHDEAGELLRTRVRILTDQYGPGHPQSLLARVNVAILQQQIGEVDAAIEQFADIIAIAEETEDFDRSYLGYFELQYGQALYRQDHFGESETALLQAWELMVEAFTPQHDQSRSAALSLLALYEKWGRPEDATHWRSKARSIGATMPEGTSNP